MIFCRIPREKALYEWDKLLYNVMYNILGVCGMNCMRCGRDIEDGAFCGECLENMKKYPVNPGVAIRIPRRPDPQLKRVQRRKLISEEEQIRSLRKRLWIMTAVAAVLLVMLIGLLIPSVNHFLSEHEVLLPGQNYSAATDGDPQS